MTVFTSIEQIEAFFASISYKKKDFPPFLMLHKALALLDNPQNTLQYIHITGTNGKGSTANYLSHFLKANELNVGLFTSPHIFNITERIKINNESIDETDFVMHFNRLYQLLGDTCQLIQFEWLYLIALDYFMNKDVDIVILEVGIGGLYDTTNTIPHKLAAVITNITYDHQQLLGTSLADITVQKRAIITKDTQFAFIGNISDPSILALIEQQLVQTDTQAYYLFADFSFTREKQSFSIFGDELQVNDVILPAYQYENIALALAVAYKTLAHFQKIFDMSQAQKVIETVQLPIRFEVIEREEKTYIFDGAHNIDGLTTMLQALEERFPDDTYTFVYCAMADKAYETMLEMLEKKGKVVLYDYHPIYARAIELTDVGTHPIITDKTALKAFISAETNPLIIYVGSMYYVSYIRDLFKKGLLP